MPSWKSVGSPYWDGAYAKIDCEAQNLDPEKTYIAKLYHEEDFAGQNVLTNNECTVSMTSVWMDNHGLIPPFDVDVKLYEGHDILHDTISRTIPEKSQMIHFEFSNSPYAWCLGKTYSIGQTIEEAAGTDVTIFCDIKCTDPGNTEARGRLVVHWSGAIKCTSPWRWYYIDEIEPNQTCTVQIPSTEKDAAFYVDADDVGQHDPRCCITLKPLVQYLTITPTSKIIAPEGDWFNLYVVSNVTWSVSDNATWIHCSPTSGSGDGIVAVTVDANPNTSSRTGTITVTGGGITRTCTVSQGGTTIYLTISPTSHPSPAAGDTFPITVTSNLGWTLSDNRPWISCSPTSGSGNDTITVTVNENSGTLSRTGTVYVEGGGIMRTCAVTQSGASCICGNWQDQECTEPGKRRQTRTCTPAGCDIEERIIDDPTCVESTCNQQFYLEDIDTGNYITGATVVVGGIECTEYPSIERYQINDLTEGLWYNVEASKSGYTCPDDICKDTFEACGSAITLKLKAPVTPCSEYNEEQPCINAGCFWYDNACHEYGPVECSDYTDAITCEANLCHWWSDGTCHDTEEPIECDQGFRVTVKNIPSTGLKVQGMEKALLKSCDDPAMWAAGPSLLKEVTLSNPTITFDKQDGYHMPHPGEEWCIRVIDNDLYALDELKTPETVPSSGCDEVSLNGWNGCKWRILLTGPSEVLVNKPFQIKATLYEIPSNALSANKRVEFYEGDISGTPIWTDDTDEDGVALCTVPAKPTLGTYTYFAKYINAPTFCEPESGLSVDIVETIEPEGLWEQLIQFIVDTFDVSPEQAKTIAYASGGLVGVLFLSSMLKS